jgi:hypothetical protein
MYGLIQRRRTARAVCHPHADGHKPSSREDKGQPTFAGACALQIG